MYKTRLSTPNTTDKYWIHTSKGGLNSCILISGNSVLPNCVGYAWGRFYELLGSVPKLSRGNAENWYGYKDGYQRGQVPKLGAVACWSKGKTGVGSDGAGHVAIVEKIDADGTITTSNSGYNGPRFYTKVIKKPYSLGGTYVFQGFIYNPAVDEVAVIETKSTSYTTYKVVKGDTLAAIARKYSTTWQELAAYNNMANPNLITVGQLIRIPTPTTIEEPKVAPIVVPEVVEEPEIIPEIIEKEIDFTGYTKIWEAPEDGEFEVSIIATKGQAIYRKD